jgi:Histidine kinase
MMLILSHTFAISNTTTNLVQLYFLFFWAGASAFMAIFSFFKSVINDWERANLYCSATYLCFFFNVILWAHVFDFWQNAWQMGLWFNQMIPICMFLLYREFLNTRRERPLLYRFMTGAIVVLFVCNLAVLYELFFNQKNMTSDLVFEYVLVFVELYLPFAYLRYWRHPIYRYAAWSSWVAAAAFIGYVLIARFDLPSPFSKEFPPANLMNFALMIDGILFLFALALRDRQIVTEKIRLEEQATANELKALRSQMNPHFIFNALNSIKSFTLNNDAESANFYLTKFSKLIRQVLDNSRNERISLKNELETLTLYLDMEKLRVGDKFDYEIVVDEDVETDFVEIPPLLVQPYVENAIWHGLMHKEEKGLVKITVEAHNLATLRITITDNGIGRQKSTEIKSKTGSSHKSFGLKITQERLDVIKKLYNINATVSFEDLKNQQNEAIGTKVLIKIPI